MNYGYYQESVLKQQKLKELKRLGKGAALCVILFIAISNLLWIIVTSLGLEYYASFDTLMNESYSMVATMVAICIPFFIFGASINKKTDDDILPLGKPKDKKDMALSVFAGVFVCFVGNFVVSYLVAILDKVGVHLTSPDQTSPTGGFALFIYILRLTVVAAVIEEVCIRGIVMQPLRKYGNMFAIVVSSLIFALMHGNLIQAPFAFIAGFAMGYFSIVTGTLWTGVLIHFTNNLTSGIMEYFYAIGKQELGDNIGSAIMYTLMAVGLVCMIIFFKKRGTINIDQESDLTRGERAKAYFLNLPMIIAFLLMFIITAAYIDIS